MTMTTRFLRGLRLLLPLAAIAALTGCAARTASPPPASPSMAEDAEPLPPGVKPLTMEQEETFGTSAE